MICPRCFDDGKGDVNMTASKTTSHVHNPSDAHGHGELDGVILVCTKCGHEEEGESEDLISLPDNDNDN